MIYIDVFQVNKFNKEYRYFIKATQIVLELEKFLDP